MEWSALSLIISAVFIHISNASFLSTIDEFRKIDNLRGPNKRQGGVNEPYTDGSGEYGGDTQYGGDENLNCDEIMRQCQCDNSGGGRKGGGGDPWSGWGGSPSRPQPQTQTRHSPGSRKRHGEADYPLDDPEDTPYDVMKTAGGSEYPGEGEEASDDPEAFDARSSGGDVYGEDGYLRPKPDTPKLNKRGGSGNHHSLPRGPQNPHVRENLRFHNDSIAYDE